MSKSEDSLDSKGSRRDRLKGWVRKKSGTRDVGGITESVRSNLSSALDEAKKGKQQETFAEAMERQGVESSKLPTIHARIRLTFFVCSAASIFAIFLSVYLAVSRQGYVGPVPISVFMALVLSVWMGAKAFEASFRAWQVKTRRLGSVREYRQQGEIIPPPFPTSESKDAARTR